MPIKMCVLSPGLLEYDFLWTCHDSSSRSPVAGHGGDASHLSYAGRCRAGLDQGTLRPAEVSAVTE